MSPLKFITLKNGLQCCLRKATINDAEAILYHTKKTSAESDFLLRYYDEITTTVAQNKSYLAYRLELSCSLVLVALIDNVIIGTITVQPTSNCERYRHRGELGISIQQAYCNLGLGSSLMLHAIDFAKSVGFHQLELEVNSKNEHAIALYMKYGFQVYGRRPDSIRFRNGSYANSYLMFLSLKD